ncbi:M56 family metallopeptidase [Vallitalea pronyensis]|uniref:M56 family metallopeptidase n=1 Tax=Vallitalea pronyensis TaxID=1348613 RepID=UPI001FE6D17F|nr:M56 family metallopeptidase [Vallitalea pronyensis]
MISSISKVHRLIEAVDSFVSQSLPLPTVGASANPLQIYVEIGAYVWIFGIIALLVYSFVSILSLYKQLKSAQLIEKNIFEANNLKIPFVLGLVRPKIYLPVGLSATERSYILLHEQTHIQRKDHMIKILAFLILSIHWFNPLVWVSFILMSKDMELSCDERVLKEMDEDIKKPYANSLLSLATRKPIYNGSPLAFGEGNVKGRIKNVLNYRKPRFWVIVVALVVAIVVSIGLFTDPITVKEDNNSLTSQLLKNKTEYVGDNSKVGSIISLLTFSKNITYDSFELFTDSKPFSITVNLKTDTETRNLYSGEANQQQFQDNAMIMFALIGNVEYINFNLDDGLIPYSMQYTREWANDQYGKNVRDFAKSKEEFSKLINGNMLLETNEDIKKFVEDDLDNNNINKPNEIKFGFYECQYDETNYWIRLERDFTCQWGIFNISYVHDGEYDIVNEKVLLHVEEFDLVLKINENNTLEIIEAENEDWIGDLYIWRKNSLEPTIPIWSVNQNIGADMAFLDFASDDIVIFHGYFGLFVYDIKSRQIIRSLDLKPLKCNYTQGDYYCDVSVSMDGNIVQLHPMNSKNMFVYTVSDNTLYEKTYKPMDKPFSSQFVSIDEVINSKKFGNYSFEVVRFDTGEYGYLQTSDWTLGSLTYVRGDMVYTLFTEKESDKSDTLSDKITDWEPTTYETVNNFDGVTMTLKEGTASSISLTLVIENNSSSYCTYGEYFWLEKKINGSWYQVPVAIDGDYAFHDIGYDLASGDNRELKVDWGWLYGDLDNGEYRIVKDILDFRSTGDYDKYYLTAGFTVD